jgi:hypothetical protein
VHELFDNAILFHAAECGSNLAAVSAGNRGPDAIQLWLL